jgi:hypothetical protein
MPKLKEFIDYLQYIFRNDIKGEVDNKGDIRFRIDENTDIYLGFLPAGNGKLCAEIYKKINFYDAYSPEEVLSAFQYCHAHPFRKSLKKKSSLKNKLVI